MKATGGLGPLGVNEELEIREREREREKEQ